MSPESGWLQAAEEETVDDPVGYWLEDELAVLGMHPPELAYVVVDEMVAGRVGLVVAEWPRIDAAGRILFLGETGRVGCDQEELEGRLARSRRLLAQDLPAIALAPGAIEEVRGRPLAIGDVFGVVNPSPGAPLWLAARESPLAEWMADPIDLTAQGREAAKVSLYGAVAGPPLSEPELEGLRVEAEDAANRPEAEPPAPAEV